MLIETLKFKTPRIARPGAVKVPAARQENPGARGVQGIGAALLRV